MSTRNRRPTPHLETLAGVADRASGAQQMHQPDNSVMQSLMGAQASVMDLFGGFTEPELDEETLTDRARAADQLSGKFEIVQNESDVDGNAVTQEQFDEIVAMYSDIRMGKTNIEIGEGLTGEDLEAFQAGAMEDIGRILQTRSGRELMKHTMHAEDEDGNALKTKIKRHTKANMAETQADDDHAAMNGEGAGATIEYRPGETIKAGNQSGGSWGNSWRSDVTLYHELAHAKHMHDGQLSKNAMTEEENSIGMGSGFLPEHWQYFENRYRHERRMIGQGTHGVIDGDREMGQRDNLGGGEAGGLDMATPYSYADDAFVPGTR